MDWTFNIFRVADIYQSEEIHTRIIAELINPKSTFHNNGERFLREFADSMEFKKFGINLDYDKVFVKTEIITRHIARKRRVDFVIWDYNYYIPFEVKIHAKDQERQIDDYLEHAEEQQVQVPVFFYLNRDGKEPGKISLSDINKHKVQTVTFKKQIVDWLIRCSRLSGVPKDARIIMTHMIDNIDGNFTKGDSVIDLIRDDLIKHNYEWSKQVQFHPWVGSNYENMPRKILLLGDSHHGDEPGNDITQYVVQRFYQHQLKQKQFFNGIIWTLYGNKSDLEDKYNNIAFYNYVQELVSGPRVRPPHDDYIAAQEPFVEVLEKLHPDMVISFGYTLRWYLQKLTTDNWKVHSADIKHDIYESSLCVKNKSVLIYSLPHPCGSKFNRQVYYKYLLKHGLSLP